MVYQYTAIGDSLTTGFGAMPGNGFVPVYRRMAEVRLRRFVAYNNLGVNGMTSSELLQRVQHNPVFRQNLQEADIVTVSIGGNDLIQAARHAGPGGQDNKALGKALQECKRNTGDLISAIYRLKSSGGRHWIMRTVGLYNPYPNLPEATEWVKAFNRFCSQRGGANYAFADTYRLFAGNERELLSLDRLHPNGRGYRIIADQLDAFGYAGIS